VIQYAIAAERHELFLHGIVVGNQRRLRAAAAGAGVLVVGDVMGQSDDVKDRDARHRTRHRDVIALTHVM